MQEFCLSLTIKYKFVDLPIEYFLEHSTLGLVENQYNTLINVEWARLYGQDVLNSYTFWSIVLQHKNVGGDTVFKNLDKFFL